MKKIIEIGLRMKAAGEFRRSERGVMDIGAILLMGIGMVFLAVGFIIFPIVTTATDALLAYEFTTNTAITDASFTGFTAVIGITPLLILIGFISAAVFAMFLGVRIAKGGGGTKLDLGSLLLLGVSMIFIAIGLIILPVALDGIATVIHGGGAGVNPLYIGLSPILLVTPLLILISFVSAAVISGFFGIKRVGGST
ncbi:hypothetical protein LCGC14_1496580 [marine sediment metagenome]|uniref:DUF973 family protein n=1 Tax=marine sediment metagenome TaxID=412755 RepID=A0A0F9J5A4_9ZZZZ